MNVRRVIRNLFLPPWRVRLVFPARTLRAIEAAIRAAETTHAGEIRFAVESGLPFLPLLRGQPARERALEVFSQLRVWDTQRNNGVLIYLLLADRDVEIIADRDAHARVSTEGWEKICREMETLFRQGKFEQGVLHGIRSVSAHLARHYPPQKKDSNELDDRPVVF
ncbi:membrane protein [Sulfuricaulis limicola]|uniref:Membrane protein n=1 Tax=Sulfuricaulis limicola TaxID=1620215 RepID=A0A1B4XHT4_9GAMM|nr:TPM domain-containing protein [Sulfuricaulis limicola]BAV34370.1 membrane protein [Sulfuricaulis limicola]